MESKAQASIVRTLPKMELEKLDMGIAALLIAASLTVAAAKVIVMNEPLYSAVGVNSETEESVVVKRDLTFAECMSIENVDCWSQTGDWSVINALPDGYFDGETVRDVILR